jgi:sec-independent protein translocase protein TatC
MSPVMEESCGHIEHATRPQGERSTVAQAGHCIMALRRRIPLGIRTVAPDEKLSVVDHLSELRRRLVVCIAAIVVGFIGAYIFRDHILHLLVRQLPPRQRGFGLVTLSPTEPFITIMEVCLWTAILITLPILIFQVYAFVIPAVGRQSRRKTLALIGGVSGLFLLGVGFGYVFVLPLALKFLLGFGGSQFTSQVRAADYLGFVATLLFICGLTFEVPLAMAAFARMGLITPEMYRKHWRLAVVAIAGAAAFLPTGDPFSMLLIMVPMIVLYVVGIWLSSVVGRPLVWKSASWTETPTPTPDEPVSPSV